MSRNVATKESSITIDREGVTDPNLLTVGKLTIMDRSLCALAEIS